MPSVQNPAHGARTGKLAMRLIVCLAFVVGTIVVATCLATGIAYLIASRTYEVDALVRVSREADSANITQRRPADPKTVDAFIQSQPYLVTSQPVLVTALRDPGVSQLSLLRAEPDKVRWLKNNLTVGYLGDSEVMLIRMRGARPKELVRIVNAVTDAYLEEAVNSARDERRRQLQMLRDEFDNLEDKIRKNQELYNRLARELGIVTGEEANASKRLILTQLAGLEKQRRDIEKKLMESERNLNNFTMSDASALAEPAVEVELSNEITLLRKRLELLEAERQKLQTEFEELRSQLREMLNEGESNEERLEINDKESRRDFIRDQIYSTEERIRESQRNLQLAEFKRSLLNESQNQASATALETARQKLESDRDFLRVKRQELDDQLEKKKQELDNLRRFDSELSSIARNLEIDKRSSDALKREISSIEVDLNLSRRIERISEAAMPEGTLGLFEWLDWTE